MHKRCVPLITTGHCGSSLIMQILVDFGFRSPPGPTDPRHPCGYHDEPALCAPQVQKDWGAFEAELREHTERYPRWAFKLSSGLIHWGPRVLELLPDPRPVLLLRRDSARPRSTAGHMPGNREVSWYDWFMEALPPLLDQVGPPLLAFTWEAFLADPQPLIERLYRHTVGTFPPEAVVRKALERVK